MFSGSEIKKQARSVLRKNYAQSITAYMVPGTLIVAVCVVAELLGYAGLPWFAGAVVIVLADVFLLGPIQVGTARYALQNREQKAQMADLLYGFRKGYLNTVLVMACAKLLVLVQMLLIVPGVICACRFRMIPLILADAPRTGLKEVFSRSRQMMEEEVKPALMLELSFFGWWALSLLTGGVLCIFWSVPYYCQTCAELYAVNPRRPEGSQGTDETDDEDDEEDIDDEDIDDVEDTDVEEDTADEEDAGSEEDQADEYDEKDRNDSGPDEEHITEEEPDFDEEHLTEEEPDFDEEHITEEESDYDEEPYYDEDPDYADDPDYDDLDYTEDFNFEDEGEFVRARSNVRTGSETGPETESETEPETAAEAVSEAIPEAAAEPASKPRRIQLRRAPSVEEEIPSGYDRKMEMETQTVPIMTEEEIVFQAALRSAEEEIRRYQRETADLLLKERGFSRESLDNPSDGFLDETLTQPIDLELVEKALSDQNRS